VSLKITTWNIEHTSRLLTASPSPTILNRRLRVQQTIQNINPDILCIQEGPKGEQAITDFCSIVLENQWVPVLLRQAEEPLGHRDKEYQLKGNQWIWFLVRAELANRCRLQSPTIWQAFTGTRQWPINYWGEERAKQHYHYRHPQVLIYTGEEGQELEIIGVHLKSKINMLKINRDTEGNLVGGYVAEATEARIKLATEARNIRQYIDEKFNQLQYPGIVVLGDCNDGPGHDYFETRYLFFDLISNIQGDVMMAERFFNHALFDFPGHLRWTAKYRDAVLGIPASQNPLLLDHLLISQPLCRGNLALVVNEQAGTVEHEAYQRYNAGATANAKSSDHHPASCTLEPNEPEA